jgi:hypothetical protein
MKKNLLQLCAAVTVVAALFTACSKQSSEEAAAPPKQDGKATIAYQIQAVNSTTSIAGDNAGIERLGRIMNDNSLASLPSIRFDLTWDSIKLRFRELMFNAWAGPDQINLSIKSDRYIDIIDSTSLGSVVVPVGKFDSVNVFLHAGGDSAKPAVIMNGRITWKQTDIPIDVIILGDIKLYAAGKNVAIGQDGLTFDGKLTLDLDLVMSKLQIGDFTGTFQGGRIVLVVDVNTDANNRLKSALESSMKADYILRQ